MIFTSRKSAQYRLLVADKELHVDAVSVYADSPEVVETSTCRNASLPSGKYVIAAIASLIFILASSTIIFNVPSTRGSDGEIGQTASSNSSTPTSAVSVDDFASSNCSHRREWRTLSSEAQDEYVGAVRCLLTKSSKLASRLRVQGISAYSDFPYIHAHIGYRTHNSAPFLPWHRYLLHIYETTLREECAYTGGLVYWDWTLDVADLTKSPVLDAKTGFGGDGESGGEITVGQHGRCLREGPFHDVQALWYDVKYQPHCLSRGFRNDNGTGMIDTSQITPEKIHAIMQLDQYEQFVQELESKVHDAIPFGIGGDFETFSAPFDPLFYLHHVQLDRLWWRWQHADQMSRLFAYGGHTGRHTIELGKLTDRILMGDLAPAIEVRDIMDTRGNGTILCYDYQ